uniref:MFS domain-containing protein n=1 Tax=Rhabditophanes sp. KR3021 TaxID=114890 RepID=A0AC35TXJ8_9BILA
MDAKHEGSAFFSFKSRRLQIILLMMLGWAFMAFTRTQLSISMTCMVNSTSITLSQSKKDSYNHAIIRPECINKDLTKAHTTNKSLMINDYGGTLVWDNQVQSYIISATYWGSIFTVLPAGYLSDRTSPKVMMMFGASIYAASSFILPYLAESHGPTPVFISRFVMGLGEGLLLPSSSTMISRWFPNPEKPMATSIFTVGNQLAGFFGNPFAAFMCATSGWQLTFYLCSIILVIWLAGWNYIVQDRPGSAKWISDEEKMYLIGALGTQAMTTHKKQLVIPFKAIFTSIPFYAAVLCTFVGNGYSVFATMYIPTFLKETLFVDVMDNGLISAIPVLIQIFTKLSWSYLISRLQKSNILSATQSVKLSQFVSMIMMSSGLVLLPVLLDCQQPYKTVLCLTLITSGFGIAIAGYMTSILSMAPAITGTISAISNVCAIIARILTPWIISLYKTTDDVNGWLPLLWGMAIAWILVSIIFILFGSGQSQSWGLNVDDATSLQTSQSYFSSIDTKTALTSLIIDTTKESEKKEVV